MGAETTPVVAQRLVFPQGGVAADATALYLRGEGRILGRDELRIPAGRTVSFATYFNAFPVGIWSSAAGVDRVTLRLGSEGEGTHRLFGIAAEGAPRLLAEARGKGEIDLDSGPLADDLTWLWLESRAGDDAAIRLHAARWIVPARPRSVRILVAITTMNRVDDCVEVIEALGGAELADALEEIVVVDQGSDPLSPRLPASPLPNGVPVRLIEQENLGGSGGFSRGMLEASAADVTHVLLLDDDVRLEPESIRRLQTLASTAHDEPLLGAQMLSLREPTVLHSMGEQMDRRAMWWHGTEPGLSAADLATRPLESTPELRRFRPVDFNGWWMCLIPVAAVRKIGASLPLFIKWDDAEYGLRAAQAGHRTVTVPGAALWHIPWTSKDDGLDWQAYYQLRNRVVTALVHERRPRRLLPITWVQDVNHVLCLQYGSVRLRNTALEDVLRGPDHLRATLRGGRSRAQQVLADAGQELRPEATSRAMRGTGSVARAPQGPRALAGRLLRVLGHQLRAAKTSAAGPEQVARDQGKWWRLGLADEVELRSATGQGFFVLRRSRRRALALLMRSVWLRFRIRIAWPVLAARYRDGAPEQAGRAKWGGL
ncbi:glycosyltransferase [Microbacterium azadirachtae]|uniref:glycosyltransferase n=1 Tax=Microbacterium azadirachtae TaxID=582680 RepID=UPI003F754FFF